LQVAAGVAATEAARALAASAAAGSCGASSSASFGSSSLGGGFDDEMGLEDADLHTAAQAQQRRQAAEQVRVRVSPFVVYVPPRFAWWPQAPAQALRRLRPPLPHPIYIFFQYIYSLLVLHVSFRFAWWLKAPTQAPRLPRRRRRPSPAAAG